MYLRLLSTLLRMVSKLFASVLYCNLTMFLSNLMVEACYAWLQGQQRPRSLGEIWMNLEEFVGEKYGFG